VSTATDEVVADVDTDVDFTEQDDERDEVAAGDEGTSEKDEKAPARKKRGEIPEGYVTPIGLCKEINAQGLYTGEGELKPQAVYSYIRNAPAAHPFPQGQVLDDGRTVYKLEEGLAWWKEKNERAATRKKNAADKASATKEKAAKATETEGESTTNEPVVEAE
jgi:hypothetical protein